MGLEGIKVFFGNPYGVYYPEQLVTGKVHFYVVNNPEIVQGL